MKSLIYLYVGGALCLLWANYKYRIVSNKDVFNKKQAATIEITNSSLVKSHLYKLKSAEKSALNVSRKLSSDPNQVTYIIERENKHINDVMVDYPFKNGTKLDDYVYEMGGNPIKAIISTTWRSGSTFLGDILLSHPATFYHYEPLLHFGIHQIGWEKNNATDAVRIVKQLMQCDYRNMGEYIAYGQIHPDLLMHNLYFWRNCGSPRNPNCYNPDFLGKLCRLFPFQSIKTVRMRVQLMREFLQDPRGTLQSRTHRSWCPGNPDCDQAKNLCSDLLQDYKAASEMIKEFKDKFLVLRYEDFTKDLSKNTPSILNFYGFQMHPNVQSFLDSHTKHNKGGVSSTFRNSSTAPYHWKKDLSFKRILEIQADCTEALNSWGYFVYKTEDQLATVHPVLEYSLLP